MVKHSAQMWAHWLVLQLDWNLVQRKDQHLGWNSVPGLEHQMEQSLEQQMALSLAPHWVQEMVQHLEQHLGQSLEWQRDCWWGPQ